MFLFDHKLRNSTESHDTAAQLCHRIGLTLYREACNEPGSMQTVFVQVCALVENMCRANILEHRSVVS
jgi:hypothetical protein